MPAPLANRFIHLEMKPEFDDWLEWAVNHNIHKDVVGYLTFSKKDLYDFDPKSPSRSFATPRSWSFVSELLSDDLDENTVTDLVSGAVGDVHAVLESLEPLAGGEGDAFHADAHPVDALIAAEPAGELVPTGPTPEHDGTGALGGPERDGSHPSDGH